MKYVQLELFNNKTSIIISLKYEYLEKILNGEKKYEYRFKFPHENVEAYIYIPSPHKKLVGVMEFDCTEWMNKEDASIFYQNIGDGEYETLYNWIGDKKGCYVSRICSLLLFNEEIEFNYLRNNFDFYAPQEWLYLHKKVDLHNFLDKIKGKNILKKVWL